MWHGSHARLAPRPAAFLARTALHTIPESYERGMIEPKILHPFARDPQILAEQLTHVFSLYTFTKFI